MTELNRTERESRLYLKGVHGVLRGDGEEKT